MTTPTWSAEARDVLRVDGRDALAYLQSQLSQDLRPLAIGESAYSLVLQPAGRVEVLLRVLRVADDAYVLDTDAGAGAALRARLERFKIRVAVEIGDLDWACIAVRGPGAADVPVPDGAWKVAAWRGDGTAVDLVGPRDVVGPPPGAPEAGAADLLAARIEAAWPSAGVDYEVGAAIPASLGVTDEAVSFTKGCYPGQELVERMDSRGAQAPRTLHTVDVPAGTRPGDEVDVDGHRVTVTSVAGTRAIALVPRST